MSIADLMEQMSDAGAPMPAILIAVRAIEATETALAEKRATERDRKRRQRERAGTVTGQSRDADGTVTDTPSPLSPPLKAPPDPLKITPPISPQPHSIPRARFAPPDGVSGEQWAGFLKLRGAKRQPMTDRGYSLIQGKLRTIAEHGFPPGDMIDLAIERGWTTVHEPDERKANGYQRDDRDPTTVALELLAAQDRTRENAQAGGPNFDVGGSTGGLDQRGG